MLGDYFENVTQLSIDKIEAYLDEKRTQAMRFSSYLERGGLTPIHKKLAEYRRCLRGKREKLQQKNLEGVHL